MRSLCRSSPSRYIYTTQGQGCSLHLASIRYGCSLHHIRLQDASRPCGQLLGCVHLRGGPLPASLLLAPLHLIASHLTALLRATIHNQVSIF